VCRRSRVHYLGAGLWAGSGYGQVETGTETRWERVAFELAFSARRFGAEEAMR
jgi:hypothetical protein